MTQTPQLPKRWFVPFPEKKALTGHPCQDACNGNHKMGQLLIYFLQEASWELERQDLPESCKVVKFTRSHDHILKRVKISEKSLIQFLKQFNTWGFVKSEQYSKEFTAYADPIHEAMHHPILTKKIRQKSCTSTSEKSTTSSTDEESCNVYLLQQKVEALEKVQLYNISLEARVKAHSEALETESCKVVELQQKVYSLQLYNSALSTWIEAVSEALGIACPIDSSIDSLRESNRDSFVESPNGHSDPNTPTLHNFPIGSTTQGEAHDPLPALLGSTDDSESAAPSNQPVSVVEVATGNSTTHESEHRANATSTTLDAPGDTLPGSGTDFPLGQSKPTLQQMEMEQEAHDTVTTLEQNTPKPAESSPGSGAQPSSGIQQVSPSQRQLIEPPNTPEQHSGPFPSDTPVTPGAAQAGQEHYTTPEDWEAARSLFQEEIRARWAAWDRQQRRAYGGKWQTYEKQERLAWEILHPKPVDEALEQACRDIYTKLTTQWRGYEWDGKGAVINERKFIRCFVLKYRREFPDTVTLFEDIYTHLTTKHIKYSSDSYSTTVSASIVFHESSGVIQLWKKPKSQSNGHAPYTQNGHTKVTPIRSNALPTFTEADYEQLKRMPV